MTSRNARVVDSAGNTITEPEGVRERWRLYIEALYDKEGNTRRRIYRLRGRRG